MRHLAWQLILVGLMVHPASAGEQDKRLDVYWIDVEGGAATLMVMPTGECVLVDTGNPGPRDARRIFKVVAETAGLRKIDHLVTTHYHRDHFGGASLLSTMIPIGTVHDNGELKGERDQPDPDYRKFKCEQRTVISPGDTLKLTSTETPLSIKCLGTRREFIEGNDANKNADPVCASFEPRDRDISDNANSVVLLVSFGPFRFYDGGDLTWNQEHRLVCPNNLVGEVDVYQVTHHGLDSSNNPTVLRALKPTVAIMNNGVTKGCQPQTFQTLQATKTLSAIYQMHKNLRKDKEHNTADEYIANLEKDCEGNYIKLSVAPDGKSYTVSIPANGHEKTYQTRGAAAE